MTTRTGRDAQSRRLRSCHARHAQHTTIIVVRAAELRVLLRTLYRERASMLHR